MTHDLKSEVSGDYATTLLILAEVKWELCPQGEFDLDLQVTVVFLLHSFFLAACDL